MTLLEVLVVPYRKLDARLAQRYEMLLTRSRGVRLVEVTREHLRVAGQFLALSSVRTPDALQLACAAASGCKVFLIHDRKLPELPDVRVVSLDSYVARHSA